MDEKTKTKPQNHDTNSISYLIAIVLLVLGVFAPAIITIYDSEWLMQTIVQGAFWMYTINSYGNGFSPLTYDPTIVFLWVLRVVPAYQLFRYYRGKTTKKRAYISSLVGDGVFVFPAFFYDAIVTRFS